MIITLRANREFYHPTKKWVASGTQFQIEIDIEGTPLNSFWASIVKNIEIDEAFSIVKEETPITTTNKTKK